MYFTIRFHEKKKKKEKKKKYKIIRELYFTIRFQKKKKKKEWSFIAIRRILKLPTDKELSRNNIESDFAARK